jgi:hypothetical protein
MILTWILSNRERVRKFRFSPHLRAKVCALETRGLRRDFVHALRFFPAPTERLLELYLRFFRGAIQDFPDTQRTQTFLESHTSRLGVQGDNRTQQRHDAKRRGTVRQRALRVAPMRGF